MTFEEEIDLNLFINLFVKKPNNDVKAELNPIKNKTFHLNQNPFIKCQKLILSKFIK